MPRTRPPISRYTKTVPSTKDALRQVVNPLSPFDKCKSAAYVRKALTHAIAKTVPGRTIDKRADLIPTQEMIELIIQYKSSQDMYSAISEEKHIKQVATVTSTNLRNAENFFNHAISASDEVKPILYYYGALSFWQFIAKLLIQRQVKGNRGHGMSVTCESEGWDFDKSWTRKCWVDFTGTGDFSFVVDALTISGFPSLFSTFILRHSAGKGSPYVCLPNPYPLKSLGKISLDMLCNFDGTKFLSDHPEVLEWAKSGPHFWETTTLLMDYIVTFIASNLARYYIPAWQAVIEAEKSSIYNDIRDAFVAVSETTPHFFLDKTPFQFGFT